MAQEVLIIHESYSSRNNESTHYNITSNSVQASKKRGKVNSLLSSLKDIFLPIGYPNSVSSDYASYQLWDTAQAFCSSITGALAGQAVLQSYGVGNESASVLAATMIWLLRDGVGMVGRIGFTWSRGAALDFDCKRYRLLADFLNDIGLLLQFTSPVIGDAGSIAVTLTLCCASVLMSIVGVCGGATRAALTQHQARQHNMADVSAKDSSQETVVNLIALIANLILLPSLTGALSVPAFIIFSILHLISNWFAVRAVVMETFNPSRLHIAIKSFVNSSCTDCCSVQYANAHEPLLFTQCAPVQLGCSLSVAAAAVPPSLILQSINGADTYAICCNDNSIMVMLQDSANDVNILRAMVQCELLHLYRTEPHTANILLGESFKDVQQLNYAEISKRLADRYFDRFLQTASASGWRIDRGAFNLQQFRFSFAKNY